MGSSKGGLGFGVSGLGVGVERLGLAFRGSGATDLGFCGFRGSE